MVKSAEQRIRKWKDGMRTTPYIKCPKKNCGKLTRNYTKCKKHGLYTEDEKKEIQKERASLIKNNRTKNL